MDIMDRLLLALSAVFLIIALSPTAMAHGTAPAAHAAPEPPYDPDPDVDCDYPRHHRHGCDCRFRQERRAPKEGARRHDGLFLRFTLGPGFGSWQGTGVATAPPSIGAVQNPSGDGSKFGGSFSLGGVVSENLILHGDAWFNGNSPRQTRTALMQFGTGAFGGSLTYYWMPHNAFVSGGIGLASSWLVILDPDDLYQFDRGNRDRIPDGINAGTGIAAYLTVGKEWWISDNWAMGVAVQGDFARTQGRDLDINYSGLKVLFTATFN
jgi:hypothetical protein